MEVNVHLYGNEKYLDRIECKLDALRKQGLVLVNITRRTLELVTALVPGEVPQSVADALSEATAQLQEYTAKLDAAQQPAPPAAATTT